MPGQVVSGQKWQNKLKKIFWLFCIGMLGLLMMPLPDYHPKFSKSVYSREGKLLSAMVSPEQQWCLPLSNPLPEKFKTCVILYEDAYFKFHPGINPVSTLKALVKNVRNKKVVRGASTIPMQVMRIKNKNATRNLWNKTHEMAGALKYSVIHSKEYILTEWAQIAPFGGNTIGLQAAALRYFGRQPEHLSWAEYALLAVMPNGPSSANLGLNRQKVKTKRNFLLNKLHKKGYFDQTDLELYKHEDIPDAVKAIPQHSFHFLQFVKNKNIDESIYYSTIDFDIQQKVNEITALESSFLRMDDIRNMAAVVIDIQSNELLAYTGNVANDVSGFHYVDIVQAPRSYGSLLKPLLYAHALEQSWFLPKEMIADIPTAIGDFRPMNFDKQFRGAVRFDDMLIQSLNVPAVRVLNTVGHQGFYDLIRQLDIAKINKGANHYGLSIILGGGESTLWDLCRIYKGFAQNYRATPYPFRPVKFLKGKKEVLPKKNTEFSAATMFAMVESMSDLTRPREEKSWQRYDSDNKIAWKTGTSYGHKDAWALGFNGKYMVGVWVGNEIGEGRHDLTGVSKAAPVMFKIFNTLPQNQWFAHTPVYTRKEIISVCRESGKIAGPMCKFKDRKFIEKESYKYQQCNFHTSVSLNKANLIVTDDCIQEIVRTDTAFVLPAYMEYYYRAGHPEYKGMPASDPACQQIRPNFKIIYPQEGLKIFLPKDSEIRKNQLIAKAYHHLKDVTLYWFVDAQFSCTTLSSGDHSCISDLGKGPHTLTITDQFGNSESVSFEIIGE